MKVLTLLALSWVSAFLTALGITILWGIGVEPIVEFDITVLQAFATTSIIGIVGLRSEDVYDTPDRDISEHMIAIFIRQFVVWGSVLFTLLLQAVS